MPPVRPGGFSSPGRRPGLSIAAFAIALLLPLFSAVAQENGTAPAQPADAPVEAPAAGPDSGPPPGEAPPSAPDGAAPQEGAVPPSALPPLSLDNVVEAVDRTHETVSGTMSRTVAWFDSFFSDRRFLEEGYPESHFRLRTGVRVRERDGTSFLARIHANLVMPGASRRFRVIVEGRGNEEQTGLEPNDPTGLEFDTSEPRLGSLQALYELIRRLDVNVSVRVGARFHFPIDPFVKLRLRYERPLGTRSLFRLTEEGYATVQEGFGETTRIDLERQLAAWTLLRWTAYGTLAEAKPGYIWGSALSLLRQFTQRTAVTFEGGVSGEVEPVGVATNYVARVRFRQNVFRPWLFYEVEPELSWPRNERGAYPPTWGATFLVELQFGKPPEAAPLGPPPPDRPPDRPPG